MNTTPTTRFSKDPLPQTSPSRHDDNNLCSGRAATTPAQDQPMPEPMSKPRDRIVQICQSDHMDWIYALATITIMKEPAISLPRNKSLCGSIVSSLSPPRTKVLHGPMSRQPNLWSGPRANLLSPLGTGTATLSSRPPRPSMASSTRFSRVCGSAEKCTIFLRRMRTSRLSLPP